ncbi:MAG: DUF2894 domain-containing protein [Rhodanobacter sp.]
MSRGARPTGAWKSPRFPNRPPRQRRLVSADEAHARAIIEAWRERQANRLAPMRFCFIDALERRATNHHGEARRLLDERLSALLDAYAEDLAATPGNPESATGSNHAASTPLGQLLDHIAASASKREGAVAAQSSVFPELAALEDFRKTWSAIRSESQLRQSLAFEPANAGPLNSGALVHRSMALMRELSPGYLRHFLAYVDDLSWMEQIIAGVSGKSVTRSAATKKRARKKSGLTPGSHG